MTTPAASVLGRIARVVEAGKDLAENDFMVAMDVRGTEFRSALAALPVATDEGAVEQTARWLFIAAGNKAERWDAPYSDRASLMGLTTSQSVRAVFTKMARAVLTELLAGGGSGK